MTERVIPTGTNQQQSLLAFLRAHADGRGWVRNVTLADMIAAMGKPRHDVHKTLWRHQRGGSLKFQAHYAGKALNGITALRLTSRGMHLSEPAAIAEEATADELPPVIKARTQGARVAGAPREPAPPQPEEAVMAETPADPPVVDDVLAERIRVNYPTLQALLDRPSAYHVAAKALEQVDPDEAARILGKADSVYATDLEREVAAFLRDLLGP